MPQIVKKIISKPFSKSPAFIIGFLSSFPRRRESSSFRPFWMPLSHEQATGHGFEIGYSHITLFILNIMCLTMSTCLFPHLTEQISAFCKGVFSSKSRVSLLFASPAFTPLFLIPQSPALNSGFPFLYPGSPYPSQQSRRNPRIEIESHPHLSAPISPSPDIKEVTSVLWTRSPPMPYAWPYERQLDRVPARQRDVSLGKKDEGKT